MHLQLKIVLLALGLFVNGCSDSKNSEQNSVSSAVPERLKVPYLIAQSTSWQASQYLEITRSKWEGVDKMYPLIEPDLQMSCLRAIVLLRKYQPDSREYEVLKEPLEICRERFLVRPTKLYFDRPGFFYDFGENEPVLPRYFKARNEFVNYFGEECVKK